MKVLYMIGCICLSLLGNVSQAVETKAYIIPKTVAGVERHQMSLNGDWSFQFSPKSKWSPIQVPGEAAMQGYAIEHDKPVLYKKQFVLPADYKGQRTILRFDGVYSYARLWVNGTYVREHFGGFSRWEADITSLVKPGKKNEIKLEVTDRLDDISYASGYAHHPIGGILRDVTVYALPQTNVSDLMIETDLDDTYTDASLKVSFDISRDARVRYSLRDPKGENVNLPVAVKEVKAGRVNHDFAVAAPLKWDAEHPHLYTLDIHLEEAGKEVCRISRNVGFREIKIDGNKMLVNGQPVKLRGACRHDIHPTLGRTITAELDSLDAAIFKHTNMNFVRTSHYPPTERFLDYCDKMGLYVECETAICFVNTHRQKNYGPAASQEDPLFTDRYMGQLKEMVNSLRTHASILFWSIGNESVYGTNFQQSYDWVKKNDTTRPAIFSYPGSVAKDAACYDILSMHYPGVDGTMNQLGVQTFGFQVSSMPTIFDEWAHVPCYTYTTLQDDPNIREFWGASLDKMWSNLFDAQGGLGGAIWGYIDETFMLPEPKKGEAFWIDFARTAKPLDFQGKCVGYGEWGIVDVWRREKPEYWGTKKAYSPIRLLQMDVKEPISGMPLSLPVYNRFDHTNLDEVSIRYTYKGKEYTLEAPSVSPHRKGMLKIPAQDWTAGETILLSFYASDGMLIDAEEIALGNVNPDLAVVPAAKSALSLEETPDQILIKGDGFTVPFDKSTGLIHNATSRGKVVIEKGPFLNLDLNVNHNTGPEVREKAKNYIVDDADWKKGSLVYRRDSEGAILLDLSGTYKGIGMTMNFILRPNGELDIYYQTEGEPNGWLRESGIKFYLPEAVSHLEWTRKGYWSYYPENSFAGNKGAAALYNPKTVAYGANPEQSWNLDTHNYYYFADPGAIGDRPLTQMAKSMKENIYSYKLLIENQEAFNIVSPSASLACRLNKPTGEQLILYVNTRWDYPEIAWGDYCKALDVIPNYGNIKLRLK